MRKNYLLLLMMIICQGGLSLFAQSVTVPEESTYYSIQHAKSGLYLTRDVSEGVKGTDNDHPKINLSSSYHWDQAFIFVPVEGEDATYYIKNVDDNEYLVCGEGNAWTMFWVDDPTAITTIAKGKYQIVPVTGSTDYIQIKNLGSNMLGTDAETAGSWVYADKGTPATVNLNYFWTIKVFTTDVDKSGLQSKFDEASAFFDSTVQGNLPDQYPSLTYNTLAEVLSYAEDVLDDEMASQADVNNMLLSLTQALQDYKDSVNPLQPNTSATYYIIHSSGLYLGDGPVIADADYSPDQQFQFIAVPGQTAVYNIMVLSTGLYLTRSEENGWGLLMANDPTTDLAQFQIKSTGTGYYMIKCMRTSSGTGGDNRTNNTMGTDYPTNATSRGVYIDKTGNDVRDWWTIEDITVQGVVKTALENALAKVEDFLDYAVRGDGPDEYPAAEYDALLAAKADAQTVFDNNAATQEEVGDATAALNDALAACIAAVNSFFPDITIEYNIIHNSGLFLGEYSDADAEVENGIAIFSQTTEDDQKFQFETVDGKPGVYNIKILSLDKYLTRSDEPHIENGSIIEGKYDDYKLIWGDDPTTEYAQFEMKKAGLQDYYTVKCITEGPQRTNSYMGTDGITEFSGVFIDKDGTNVLHYWKIMDASNVSVKPVAKNTALAYAYDKLLTVTNLTGNNHVFVYSITGQLIANSEVKGTDYTKALPSGCYVVVVKGNSYFRGIVIVR